MMKQEMMQIVKQKIIAKDIFELTLTGNLTKEMTTPGQFLHIKVPQQDLLMRRPLSLASVDQQKKECVVIYRTEGTGTKRLSGLTSGGELDVLGPLGNGFKICDVKKEEHILLVGGGIGVPPLYELSKQLKSKGAIIHHILGFHDKSALFYIDKFKKLGTISITTDNGSYGIKGHIGAALPEYLESVTPDAIYACGPNALLKVINQQFLEHPRAYLSLEERMACGIGACYACVCHVADDPSGQKSKKVCDEGPIFKTGEVIV